MHHKLTLPLLLSATILTLPAIPAHASEAIIKKARCVACHAVDKKMVGPAYRDVAAKYRGQPEALAQLSAKIRNGGSGVWGAIPMMPHPADKIGDADLEAAVGWILKLE
ncbi:MAG: c-type cytochrome [Rhodocyclaceae bacterium]